MKITEIFTTGVLVIGAGAAGLRAALAAAETGVDVLLANKAPAGKSGITLTAAGGVQAPFAAGDSPELYFQDTVQNGYGLADENLAWALAQDACTRVLDAEGYGTRFIRDTDGNLKYNQLPGQSKPRNIFTKGGGIGLTGALLKACRANKNIIILDDFLVTGLLKNRTDGKPTVAGAVGLNLRSEQLTQISAGAVVMATGGCQWLWAVNDCPADATGSGIILSYRLGAELVDMEMVMFYPSVVIWPDSLKGAFVHYEFLNANMLDANVYDASGKAILPKPLPVRDEAMRLIAKAIDEGRGTERGGVYWYVGDSPKGPDTIRKTLQTLQYDYLRSHGVEPAADKVEVAPGAHYLMGGILIDEKCRTKVNALYATAECAGNFDGANRLAGTGLTATQVFGARAGFSAAAWAKNNPNAEPDPVSIEQEVERVAGRVAFSDCGPPVSQLRTKLRSAMQLYAGVNREAAGLNRLIAEAAAVRSELAAVRARHIPIFNQQLLDILELDAMCEAAAIIAGSALLREESRGHHYRLDFPAQNNPHWQRHTLTTKGETGPVFGTRAVIKLK